MDIVIKQIGGLDLKSKPPLVQDNKLTNCRNVMLDTDGSLTKRYGFQQLIGSLTNVIEVAYFRSMNEFVVFRNPSQKLEISIYDADTYVLKRTYTSTPIVDDVGSQRDIPEFDTIYGGTISEVNYDELQETLYFVIVVADNPQPMLKYDGYVIRSCGLPEPEGIQTTGSGYYYRTVYKTYDYNGNFLYSPYSLSKNKSSITSYKTLKTLIGYKKYATFTGTPSSGVEGQVLTPTQNTLDNLDHNYKANDFLMVFNKVLYTRSALTSLAIEVPYNKEFVVLEIESVTATTITFKPSSLSGIIIQTGFVQPGTPLDCQSRLTNFVSVDNLVYSLAPFEWYDNAVFNDKGYVESAIFSNKNDNDTVSSNFSIMSTIPWEFISSEVIYNSTTFKYRPPLCKYVTAYGNQLVYSQIYGIWAERNTFVSYNNKNLIMYSDISDGDSPENISRFNRQLIGESFEGGVTGAKRVKDSLIVFKENSIWSIDGALVPANYSIRRVETNNIGCKFVKSTINVDGGMLFVGNDGIYAANGFTAKKISEELDSFFTDGVSNCRSIVNYKGDQYLFYLYKDSTHYIICYDYGFKQFFIWNGLDCSKGISSDTSSNIFMFSSNSIRTLSETKDDNGAAIDAYFVTKFFDLDVQDKIKKFIKARVIDFKVNTTYFLDVSVMKDWDTTEYVSESQLAMDKNTRHKYIPLVNGYSCAIRFGNNLLTDFKIGQIIVNIEPIQASDRNG